jgi:hypothetical protein
MRLIIRTIMVLAILWIGVLLSGYGVLFHSEKTSAVWVLSVNISPPAGSAPHFMFIPTAV